VGQQSSASPNITRVPTPVPDSPLIENVAADDALLKQYSAVIIDIKVMETNMLNLWHQVITLMRAYNQKVSLSSPDLVAN
jgi:hypothetical protein